MQDRTTALKSRVNPVTAVWRQPLVQAFLNDPITLFSGIFIVLVMLSVIFAPIVAPHDPNDRQVQLRHVAPFSPRDTGAGTWIVKFGECAFTVDDRTGKVSP